MGSVFATLVILGLEFVPAAVAQTLPPTSVADGVTPVSLAPGSPAGSYTLSEFETIDLYSGRLNVTLPLLKVGGRGSAGYTMGVVVTRPGWTVEVTPNGANCDYGSSNCSYNFTTTPSSDWWQPYITDYGPGMVIYRRVGRGAQACASGGPIFEKTASYVVYIDPEGTEHPLYDTLINGNVVQITCSSGNQLRGGTLNPLMVSPFVAHDGSGITFVPEVSSQEDLARIDLTRFADENFIENYNETNYGVKGKLLFPDGTEYSVESSLITKIRDRNGNTVTFTYKPVTIDGRLYPTSWVDTIKDQLNRVITVNYGVSDSQCASCDRIEFKGANGQQRYIWVKRAKIQDQLRADQNPSQQLFPVGGYGTDGFLRNVIAEVTLPDVRKYVFRYNVYGEIAKIELPTGGFMEYDHGAGFENPNGKPGADASGQLRDAPDPAQQYSTPTPPWRPAVLRRLRQRRQYTSASDSTPATTVYTPFETVTDSYMLASGLVYNVHLANSGYIKVSKSGPHMTAVEEHHYFRSESPGVTRNGPGMVLQSFNPAELFVDNDPFEGKEYLTRVPNLRETENVWGWVSTSGAAGSTGALKICQTNTMALDSAATPTSATITLYNKDFNGSDLVAASQFGNVSDVYEYDYGSAPAINRTTEPSFGLLVSNCIAPPSNFSRRTHTDYKAAGYIDISAHLRSLPQTESVYSGSGALVAETTYGYDETSLTSRTGISQLDPVSTPRGNLTSVTRKVDETPGIPTRTEYDVAGSPVKVTDGRGYTTDYEYNGTCNFAFPTKIIWPEAETGQPRYFTSFTYDCNLGRPAGATAVNGRTDSFGYGLNGDALDRLGSAQRGASNQTQYLHTDAPGALSVTTRRDQYTVSDLALSDKTAFDGLGRRTSQTQGTSDPIVTTQEYDGLGRVWQECAPKRPSDSAACTTYAYDAMSRVLSKTYSDGSLETFSYTGNETLHTDAAQKKRKIVTDAFGRIVQVNENPGGSPEYATTYEYYASGDLKTVTQAEVRPTQQAVNPRSFTYDMLGRLKTATNPETGQISYDYDNNGNVIQKTQADAVATHWQYDRLNRPTRLWYTGESGYVTPEVRYCYDGRTYDSSLGACTGSTVTAQAFQLTGIGSSVSFDTYSYDEMGRPASSSQNTTLAGTAAYPFTYGYNRDNSLKFAQYPSQRTLTTCYDSNGRVSWVAPSTPACPGTPATSYAAAAPEDYAANGGPLYLKLGNGLWESSAYNGRQQMTARQLGLTRGAAEKWSIQYDYADGSNNGNVRWHKILAPYAIQQDYTYDAMNRLETANEWQTSPGQTFWTQTFSYGVGGNRAAVSSGLGQDIQWSAGTYNANNRITDAGWHYDGRGNVDKNLMGETFFYDAENRLVVWCKHTDTTDPAQCRPKDASGQMVLGRTVYSYDGHGRRVVRQSGSADTKTVFVYDAAGQLAAEYSTEPQGTITPGTKYLTADMLGSTRVVTTAAGEAEYHDYLPFGDELAAAPGWPRNIPGYWGTSSGVTQKFTGKEREEAMGLDYFWARYFSGAQGRFTSPDPLNWLNWQRNGSSVPKALSTTNLEDEKQGRTGNPEEFRKRLEDPQRSNLYAYARNNPLRYTDPLGLWDAEGHNNLTWAAADGKFSPWDIFRMASANLAVDAFTNQGNDAAHYMPGTADAAQSVIAAALDQASSLEVAGKHDAAMAALGAGLHTVQDRTAHTAQNAGWIKHGVGYLPFVSSPDKGRQHPKEYKQALEDTRRYIERFRQQVEEKLRRESK